MNLNPFRTLVTRVNKKRPLSEPARHARRAFQKRNRFSFSLIVLVLTLLFLFLPLIVIIVYSFNESKGSDFTGLSLIWYKKLLFDSKDLWRSLLNSLIVALSSAALSTVLGTAAALGVSWYKFKGKTYIQTISFLPMVLPEVIIGVSMLIFFSGIKLPLGLFSIFAAHTTFCLPFVFLMILARIDEFDFSIVEASYDLGATERQTMFKVIVPAILPGILSGFLMAVTMSLEDFVITFFVSGPGSTTLPLYVYSMIRFGVSPVINALSFVMILGTVLIAFSMRKFLKSFAAAK
ncbi:ABC transporter permease [Treponema sp. OMZ 840]|uniref:ABC transporter permease n=1 Tax=Treponema sp. OMZ 840 TaxID=244313 RepID=UPI003D8C1058